MNYLWITRNEMLHGRSTAWRAADSIHVPTAKDAFLNRWTTARCAIAENSPDNIHAAALKHTTSVRITKRRSTEKPDYPIHRRTQDARGQPSVRRCPTQQPRSQPPRGSSYRALEILQKSGASFLTTCNVVIALPHRTSPLVMSLSTRSSNICTFEAEVLLMLRTDAIPAPGFVSLVVGPGSFSARRPVNCISSITYHRAQPRRVRLPMPIPTLPANCGEPPPNGLIASHGNSTTGCSAARLRSRPAPSNALQPGTQAQDAAAPFPMEHRGQFATSYFSRRAKSRPSIGQVWHLGAPSITNRPRKWRQLPRNTRRNASISREP